MMLRKFFIKRLKNYTLILILPFVAVMIAVLGFYAREQISTIKSESDASVARLETNVDQVFSDIIYQQSIITDNPEIALSLRKMLSEMTVDYSNYALFNTMTGLIRSVNMANPYVNSIYYAPDTSQKIYSSENGILDINTMTDTSWKDHLEDTKDRRRYATIRCYQPDSFSSGKEILCLFMRMTTIKGTTVVNMDLSKLQAKLSSLPAYPHEIYYVMNSDGAILLSTANSVTMSDNDLQVVFEVTNQQSNISKQWIKVGHGYYLVSTTSNPATGLTYISMISLRALFEMLRMPFFVFLAIFITAFIVIFIISYRVTKDSFTHIQKIVDTFSDAEKGIYPDKTEQNIHDEYDIILMNVINMFINSTVLKSNLERQKFEKQAAELAALQLQISPHFLSNTLQTLDFESRKLTGGKTSQVNTIIGNLSDILRYSLRPSDSLVSLSEELEILKKYIAIQQYRFGDDLVFYTEIEPQTLSFGVPRLILQPIIENSISHGILPAHRTGYIKLKVFLRDDRLYVSVIDTGIGMNDEQLAALRQKVTDIVGNNIGLTNVNRRLVLTYGADAALHIMSKEGYGTCISFSTLKALRSNSLNKVFLSTEE